jgi:hypothetical protein
VFEEQLERTGLPIKEYVKQNDMSTMSQLVKDMSNQMISFERKSVLPLQLLLKPLTKLPLGNKLIIFILRLFFQEPGVIFVRRIVMKIHVKSKRMKESASLVKELIQQLFLYIGLKKIMS